MAIIYSYPLQSTAVGDDIITGTKSDAVVTSKNPTVCWRISTLKNYTLTELAGKPKYDDNAAALAGGLAAGDIYQTTGAGAAPLNAAGILMVVQ
jgi:hypothetical protein|tara:strand:+ start:823 stop:1104 length:282 start_codon:yes stop_codon:yes gene_type:complete